MPAYVLAIYDIVDQKGYEPYVPAVIPLLQKYRAEVLVADYAPTVLEGSSRGVVVVLRFESEEAAREWYNDPAYAPVRKIRLDATSNRFTCLAKQFIPPTR
jgi:uncharacterized protein (DUF1330 family)